VDTAHFTQSVRARQQAAAPRAVAPSIAGAEAKIVASHNVACRQSMRNVKLFVCGGRRVRNGSSGSSGAATSMPAQAPISTQPPSVSPLMLPTRGSSIMRQPPQLGLCGARADVHVLAISS
jgi:hypothetical protein